MTTLKVQKLHDAIKKHVLVHSDTAKIISTSGTESTWLFDFRSVLLKPEYLNLLAEIFWETYEKKYPFQVGGLESAAIPFVAAIVMKGVERSTPVNGFYIRKSRKKSGLTRMIEGELDSTPVILVDDLINSGNTFLRQLEVLKENNAHITDIFTIVRFRPVNFYKFSETYHTTLHSLFSLPDFGIDEITTEVPAPINYFDVHWRFKSENPNYFYVVPKSAPAIDDRAIYFGSDSGNFWALNQSDGSVLWSYKVGFHAKGKYIFSSPALYDGIVYFGSYDGNVYALDTKTGKKRWVFMDADWIGSSPTLAPDFNLLFVGLEFGLFRRRGGIAALDMTTGKKVWEYFTPEHTHSSPKYSKKHGAVWVGSNDGKAYLHDARTGTVRWIFQTGDHIKESACFDDSRGTVAFGSLDGNLYVVDVKTGTLVFRFETKAGINSDPLVHQGNILVASLDKNLYCIDAETGTHVWSFPTAGRIFASPKVIGSSVFIGSNDGRLYEIDITSGKELRRFQATERITNAIAFNPTTQRFFLPTFANEIYCLSKQPGAN